MGGVALSGCRREAPPVSESWATMGTLVSVSVSAEGADALERVSETSQRMLEAFEAELSSYREESAISRVNRHADDAPVPLSEAGAAAVELAMGVGRLSGGAFDPTVGPLMALWGFRGGTAAVPPAQALAETLARVGLEHLIFERTPQGGTLRVDQAGVWVDLGGVAKGVAVDQLFEQLARSGVTDLMINLAGNMRVAGRARAGRRGWRIGVRDPFARDQILGVVELTGGMAVATSGNYERFVTIDGRRYAHILDPRSGWPVEGMAGVTVLAPTAGLADALSTALFVLGAEEGAALLAHYPEVSALFVRDRHPVLLEATPSFARRFEPLPEWRDAVRLLPAPDSAAMARETP